MALAHEYEHLESMLADAAPVLAAYRDALLRAGFTREEALVLVRDAQARMFGQAIGVTDGAD